MCLGDNPSYIFSYGSLIWRCGFEFETCFKGFVKGFRRRFWMKDTFHRGNPSLCGRTLTLIREEDYKTVMVNEEENEILDEERVWGVCYRVSGEVANQVLKDLDTRELIAGYQKTMVKVHVTEDIVACQAAIIYYYDLSREQTKSISPFTGYEPIEETANIIAQAYGFSGPNREYLYRLQQSLPHPDAYIDHLVHLVNQLAKKYNCQHSMQAIIIQKEAKGVLLIDSGAVAALSQRSKNLLPCGIRKVIGDFERDEIVEIRDSRTLHLISKGFSNFSSSEIKQIKGKHTKFIYEILGNNSETTSTIHLEVVSKNKMILI
ncbi:hypothetical protein ABK040_006334 [Willaertia magna]